MKKQLFSIIFAALLILPGQLAGAAPTSFQDQPLPPALGEETVKTAAQTELPSIGAYLLKVVITLGLLGAAVYWVKNRYYRVNPPGQLDSQVLRVVDKLDLSVSNSLIIVEVGSRFYLLGTGSGGVNLLTEITDQELIEELLEAKGNSPQQLDRQLVDFTSHLQKQIEKIRNLAGKGGDQ